MYGAILKLNVQRTYCSYDNADHLIALFPTNSYTERTKVRQRGDLETPIDKTFLQRSGYRVCVDLHRKWNIF